jgi:mercuric ion binding protein
MFFGYNPNKIKIMRFTPSLIVITLSGLLFTSCNKTATPQTKITIETTAKSNSIVTNANPEKATFNIEGMTCAIGCAKTIQEKLASMNGVKSATVDFEKKFATVEFDASKQTPELLLKAVQETGDGKTYVVSNMKSEPLKK